MNESINCFQSYPSFLFSWELLYLISTLLDPWCEWFHVYFLVLIPSMSLSALSVFVVLYMEIFNEIFISISTVSSETPDTSESSDPEHTSRSRSKQYKCAAVSLRKRFSGNSLQQQYLQHPFNMKQMTQEMFSASCK